MTNFDEDNLDAKLATERRAGRDAGKPKKVPTKQALSMTSGERPRLTSPQPLQESDRLTARSERRSAKKAPAHHDETNGVPPTHWSRQQLVGCAGDTHTNELSLSLLNLGVKRRKKLADLEGWRRYEPTAPLSDP